MSTIGKILWKANRQVRRMPKGNSLRNLFYDIVKPAIIRRFGRSDGFDLQIFKCYGPRNWEFEEEYGRGFGKYNPDKCWEDCWHCCGTGVYNAFRLDRYLVGRYLFHLPVKINRKMVDAYSVSSRGLFDRRIALDSDSGRFHLHLLLAIVCPLRYIRAVFRNTELKLHYKMKFWFRSSRYSMERKAHKILFGLRLVSEPYDDDIPF